MKILNTFDECNWTTSEMRLDWDYYLQIYLRRAGRQNEGCINLDYKICNFVISHEFIFFNTKVTKKVKKCFNNVSQIIIIKRMQWYPNPVDCRCISWTRVEYWWTVWSAQYVTKFADLKRGFIIYYFFYYNKMHTMPAKFLLSWGPHSNRVGIFWISVLPESQFSTF